MSSKGVLEINGAEKVLAEFGQRPAAASYFLLVDSGRRNNVRKAGILLVSAVLVLIGFLARSAIPFYAAAVFALAAFVLLYRRLLKEAKEGFPKEKCFLTDKHVVVQHSLCERKVKFVEIARVRGIRRKYVPLFGSMLILRHMDEENIDEKAEYLLFPKSPDELEVAFMDAAVRAQQAAAEAKKD